MNLSPDQPIAGILAPLFALRSENDLGIGDVQALREFVDWAAELGFRLVQLLPINETGGDNSPYNAISSVAIDPTTLVVTPDAIPDLTAADFAAVTKAPGLPKDSAGLPRDSTGISKLSTGPVNYPAVKALKRALLEKAFAAFSKKHHSRNTFRAAQFRAFVRAESSWIDGYALFRALMDENAGDERWNLWPETQRTPAAARDWLAAQKHAPRKAFERKVRFFMYIQWLAFSQWKALRAYCNEKNVALMGDVPYGISMYSADVFADRTIFDLDWGGGAPPEPFFKDDQFTQKWGQNWGIPLYRWDVMRKNKFAWWRRRVAMVRGVFNLFRVDHVLGFYRIYSFPWRPERNPEFLPLNADEARAKTGGRLPQFLPRDDSNPSNCDANRREGEEYLKALLEETGEHRLIGEDLGMVPPYVRPSLTALGIAGFKIPPWESAPDGNLIPGPAYQRLSVTTYATHDHEPLRLMWTKWDKLARAGGNDAGWAQNEMRKLAAFAGIEGPLPQPWSDAIHESLLRALFASNAWIAITMITDLFATEQRFNVPGAVAASNWSERLPRTVAAFATDRKIASKMQRIRRLLTATNRIPQNEKP